MSGELGVFDFDLRAEFFQRTRLAAPLGVLELPKFVDKGEELFGRPLQIIVFCQLLGGGRRCDDFFEDP